MHNKNSLTQGSIMKTLVSFCFPFLLANLLQALYGAGDLLVIGKYCPAYCWYAFRLFYSFYKLPQLLIRMLTGTYLYAAWEYSLSVSTMP